MAPTTRTAGASRAREDSSEDEDFMPPPSATRSTRRLAGGGARGCPAPAAAARATNGAQRGRPAAAATRGARGGARGGRATSAARGAAAGPIVGGRQNQMARRATRVRDAGVTVRGTRGRRGIVATIGHAYRIGRRAGGDESAGNTTTGTIDLSSGEDEDEEEEGDDVSDEDEDEDEDEEEMGVDDSLRDFIVADEEEEGSFFVFDDSLREMVDGRGAGSEEEDEEGEEVAGIGLLNRIFDNHFGARAPAPARRRPHDESFSQEVEEFELMEQRDSAAARRREEQLRKKEDKEEKENKDVLRTDMFGACTVCAEDEVVDPVGCIHCASFIGCRKCAKRWYRTSKQNADDKIASCPLCRHQWPGPIPEVGDMLDLVKTA
ncbi:hypothetical protein PENTCL1PPCAC_25289 [Pristionchus entomophagus]|uniref:RING-type domain-containing protein n=1 Tax=Pristionchus entomophagus TaxID=358040 RepID=A0AAV5U9R4_9BILA|nr:hypothetical protein PENTCL1PPCAC_25289 [Pristionchus entomophagus]